MYSPKKVEETIRDFERREGWTPRVYTVAECDEFVAYVQSLMEPSRTPSGNRTTWWWKDGKAPSEDRLKYIKRRIKNERFLCFASAEYFTTRYEYIRAANTRLIHFNFRIAQRILFEALALCDDQNIAIQLFILKARQLGCSTVVALFFLHRILFISNTYAVVASVQIPQSEKLKGMLDTVQDNLPFWLRVSQTSIKAKEPRWTNGSRLSVQAGGQEVGISQGDSPSCIHVSEVGDYSNPKKTLDEGLFPACHQFPSLFMVLEGTGSMSTTWQKESWDLYSSGKGRFKGLFIPPACAADLYPPDSWLRQHPVPEPWNEHVTDRTRKMRRRGELFVRSTDYLWKVLGQHWEMPKDFQWFWQCGYEEAVAKHAEREFLSQNAVTPEDAFQSKDDPVFTQETIELVNSSRKDTYLSYAITGKTILMGNENIPYQPNIEQVDQNESDIVLEWEGVDENQYRWKLVPLKPFDDSSDMECMDKLLVFEAPEHGAEYSIGIDTAHGLNTPNEDRSTLSVHRYGRNTEPDRQVASFTSLRVNAPQMARIAAAVAVLYGTDGNQNVTSANPLIVKFVIEQIRKPGDECQHQLKIMGFFDHHLMHRYDSKGNIDPNKGTQEGWFTRTYTRTILLNRFVDAVNSGWLVLNDPIVIRQLGEFMRKYKDHGLAQMEHGVGQHDDNVFSAAMAWTTLHDTENTAARVQSRWPIRKKVQDALDGWAVREMIID